MEDKHNIVFRKILVAEDSPINQIFMQRALQKICTHIDMVEDGAKAVEMARKNEYDLILMDLFMPEMDGYEATDVMRNQLKITTPIIAITAVSLPGEEQKCIDIGMNGYIIKPFTTDTIVRLTQNHLPQQELKFDEDYIFGDKDLTIDLKILYSLGDTTPEYIKMMIGVFTESLTKTITELKNLLEEKNWEGLQKKAHFAKSSLSVVRIHVLFELAKSMEHDCKTKTGLNSIYIKINMFEQLFIRAKDFLNAYIETILRQKA